MDEAALADLQFCYLTTTGRRSGNPHTIEIWFALRDGVLYLLAGGGDGSDWVRNLRADPIVGIRLGDRELGGRATVIEDPAQDALARELLVTKYAPAYSGDLTRWGRTALPVAVTLSETDAP